MGTRLADLCIVVQPGRLRAHVLAALRAGERVDLVAQRGMGAACGTPPVARRFVEACGDQASHSIRGAIDDVLEVGTDVDDGGDGRLRHVDLHQAIPVAVAAPAIRAAEADHDSLNDIVAVNQRAVQAAVGVVRQAGRGQESAALKFDVHVPTSWDRQGMAARPM